MTGPKKLGDLPLEGSFRSHQVPLPAAMSDDKQLIILSDWLVSYGIGELLNFDRRGDKPGEFVKEEVLKILPEKVERRLGMIKVNDRIPLHFYFIFDINKCVLNDMIL